MLVITLKGFHLCNSNNNGVVAMYDLCNYWFLPKNLEIVVKYAVIQDFTFCVLCLNQLSSLSLFGNDFKPKYMSKIERSVSLFPHEGNLKTFQGFGKLSKLNTSKGQKFHTHLS